MASGSNMLDAATAGKRQRSISSSFHLTTASTTALHADNRSADAMSSGAGTDGFTFGLGMGSGSFHIPFGSFDGTLQPVHTSRVDMATSQGPRAQPTSITNNQAAYNDTGNVASFDTVQAHRLSLGGPFNTIPSGA
jgi:hypothetical protein